MTYPTYTKLKDGSWGVRATGGQHLTAGATVTVAKRDGTTKTETIKAVLWSGDGVTLASIAAGKSAGKNYDPQKFNGYGARRGGYSKACVTGGNCSSFGSGRSCGGHDCDGF